MDDSSAHRPSKRALSLKYRLSLIIGLIIVIGTATLTTIAGFTTAAQVKRDYLNSATAQIEQIGWGIDSYMIGVAENVVFLATSPDLKNAGDAITTYIDKTGPLELQPRSDRIGGAEQEIYGQLNRMAASHQDYAFVYFGTDYGGYVQWPLKQLPDNYNPLERPWYSAGIGSPGEPVRTEPYYWEEEDAAIMSTVMAVNGADDEPVGVVGVDVSLQRFTILLRQLNLGEEGFVFLTSSDGTVISFPPEPDFNFKDIADLPVVGVREVFEQGYTEVSVESDLGPAYLVQVSSKETGWRLFGFVSAEEIARIIFSVIQPMIIAAVVVVLIVLLFTLWYTGRIVRELAGVSNRLVEIAGGGADLTHKLPVLRHDELGQLCIGFNDFIGSLRDIVTAIKHGTDEVSAGRDVVVTNVNETAAAVTEITENIRSVTRSQDFVREKVQESLQSANSVTVALNELRSVAEVQGEAVQRTSASVEQMNASVESILSVLAEREATIQELDRSVSASSSDMNAIKEMVDTVTQRSHDMKEAISVISGIAAKTNLLAMNAAIEAAHAGDYGRGFSVVASEIRSLAEDSSTNSKSIATALNESVSVIAKLSEAFERSEVVFRAVVAGTESTGQGFREIRSALAEFGTGTKEIVEIVSNLKTAGDRLTTQQQKLGEYLDQLNENNRDTDQISEQVSMAVGEIMRGVEQINISFTEINDRIMYLSDGIGEINAQVDAFVIE